MFIYAMNDEFQFFLPCEKRIIWHKNHKVEEEGEGGLLGLKNFTLAV